MVTGVHQHMRQPESIEKAKPNLVRSLVTVDNNNKGDMFNLRVVLRRLFLNEKEPKTKRGRKRSWKKIENDNAAQVEKATKAKKKCTKALKNVQNLPPKTRRHPKRKCVTRNYVIRSNPKSKTSKCVKTSKSPKRKEGVAKVSRKTDKIHGKSRRSRNEHTSNTHQNTSEIPTKRRSCRYKIKSIRN